MKKLLLLLLLSQASAQVTRTTPQTLLGTTEPQAGDLVQTSTSAATPVYFDNNTIGSTITFRTSRTSKLDTAGPSINYDGSMSFPAISTFNVSGIVPTNSVSSRNHVVTVTSTTVLGVTTILGDTFNIVGDAPSTLQYVCVSSGGAQARNLVLSTNTFSPCAGRPN